MRGAVAETARGTLPSGVTMGTVLTESVGNQIAIERLGRASDLVQDRADQRRNLGAGSAVLAKAVLPATDDGRRSWTEALEDVALARVDVVVHQGDAAVHHDEAVLPGDEVGSVGVVVAVVRVVVLERVAFVLGVVAVVGVLLVVVDGLVSRGRGCRRLEVVVVELEHAGGALDEDNAGRGRLTEADSRRVLGGVILDGHAVDRYNPETHHLFAVLAAPRDAVGLPADDGRRGVLLADLVGVGDVPGLEIGDQRQRELAVFREGLAIDSDVGGAAGLERVQDIEAEALYFEVNGSVPSGCVVHGD